jgi:hypothetical protein
MAAAKKSKSLKNLKSLNLWETQEGKFFTAVPG